MDTDTVRELQSFYYDGRMLLKIVFVLLLPLLAAAEVRWLDVKTLRVEGQGWSDVKSPFDRLPAKAENLVRAPVWGLSHDSAGILVRFRTDAKEIRARWTLRKKNLALPHMPATGVSGLDLYVNFNGTWRWIGNGRPEVFPLNEKTLVTGLTAEQRDYLLYLPLYNGVEAVEIGVADDVKISAPAATLQKPVVFYGTSILQGGCAARPGMAYPSIIGRMLNWPTINLGFSGNGKSELEMAKLMAELDPAAYVLDSLPNLSGAEDLARVEPFIKVLRDAHPQTPIVLVENVMYQGWRLLAGRRKSFEDKNIHLRALYERLKQTDTNLFYVEAEHLFGDDDEATVDGTHPTDIGFKRMADAIAPTVLRALAARN